MDFTPQCTLFTGACSTHCPFLLKPPIFYKILLKLMGSQLSASLALVSEQSACGSERLHLCELSQKKLLFSLALIQGASSCF